MDFKQIEAFINVVKYKSFSKAADAMFFTQPTISTHISNLEAELGNQLLDRKGRRVEMTKQGEIFYKFALDMVNSREKAVQAMEGSEHELHGILELQTSSIPGVAFIPEMLAEFREAHKGVKFYMNLSDTQMVIDNLAERRGEIGFVGSKDSSSAFEYTKVFSDKVVLISSANLELGDSVKLADVIKLPFIWRESGSATRKSFEELAAKHGYEKSDFEIAGLFSDLDSIFRGVESGLGVSIVSKKTAEALGNEKIKISEIKDFKDNRDFYMVNLKNAALSPVAEAFKSFVKEKIKRK